MGWFDSVHIQVMMAVSYTPTSHPTLIYKYPLQDGGVSVANV